MLDASPTSRAWLDSLIAGKPDHDLAPHSWQQWRTRGTYRALMAPEPPRFRTQAEQTPTTDAGRETIRVIRRHFMPDPSRPGDATGFEACAALLWKMACQESVSYQTTRPAVDGGRDAIGELRVGPAADPVPLDFSLEAKLYDLDTDQSVRTGDTKRLISRLRHRQFGVLVTTSFVAPQTYREIREDAHPVVVLAARDIVDVLNRHALTTPSQVKRWLEEEFSQL